MQKYKILKGEVVLGTVSISGVEIEGNAYFLALGLVLVVAYSELTR